MPKPHGNKLINRYETRSSTELEEIPTYQINTNLAEDVINIATGVFSPLTGFLTQNDLDGVVNEKRLD
ncbi:MAG: sulfate adenylyltransferase, partial [Candidatus Thermoplasmatota archaeon]|nr:sulfate adenylyltransferase [Candidatus Thermoplasmatota archaeon]